MEEKSRLCLLCCCAFTHKNASECMDVSSSWIAKAHFIQFCTALKCPLKERKLEDEEKEQTLLSGDLNLDYRDISVCNDCLHHISITDVARMEMSSEECKVRNMQRELLEALEELKGFVNHFSGKMKGLADIIRTSDEPCLRTHIDENLSAERIQDVLQFRQRILDDVLDLPKFHHKLGAKTHCEYTMKEIKQEVFDTGVPSPDCEIECEEDKELSDADIDSDADWNSDPFRPVQVFENEGLSIDSNQSTTSRMHTAKKSDNEISEQYDEHREGSSSGADSNSGFNEDNPDQLLLAEVKIKSGFDCFGMSEFKKKIVGRIQRKLANDLRLGNSVLDSDDPRKKYLVQFDVKTETLTVNDIEIIVHDNEESVKCSLCDFSITDKNIKRFGKNRAAEALVQDHIIGVHIGGYKCDVCNKMLPQYRYLKEHQRAHSQQWTCETCGKSYCNKSWLTNHQQQQHLCKSKSKQEAALKSRIQVPLKQLRRRKNIRASLLKRRIKRDSKPTYDSHGVSRCEQGIVSGTRKRRTLRLNSRDSSDDSNANKQKIKRAEETQKVAAPSYGSIPMARSDVDTLEISEFKQSIVRRVKKRIVQRVIMKSKEKRACNDGDFSDKADKNMKRNTNEEDFSFPDPRTKYPVEFDVKTGKLSVSNIEVIVQEGESCIKCSMCDFSISDDNKKKYGKGRSVEAIIQDHIIGVHIGGYKCEDCNKHLPQYRYLKEHQQAHGRRWKCDICGKPFQSKGGMKDHKWYHMNAAEKEEAIRNGTKNPSEGIAELSTSKCDPNELSEFKQGIVTSVLKNLERRTRGFNLKRDGNDDNSNEINSNYGSAAENNEDETFQSIRYDPRMKYHVEYDVGLQKLSVKDIEIIVHDIEECLKCSLCDFTVADEDRRRFGGVRTFEAIMQDHIIGIHIGGYKCDVCDKKLPQFRQLREHQLAHRKQWLCNICGKTFSNKFRMKEHKLELDHMSKLEKEELTRKKSNVVSEQHLDVVKSQLNDLSKPDFKKRIVNRVLRNLERATRDRLLSKHNDESVENGKNLNVAKSMETESSILDPRTMYPIEYNVVTEKLAVNGIEIIVDEIEEAVKCSLCDFSITDMNIKRFGTRAAEALVQDHVIGIHIGGYKCDACNKVLPNIINWKHHQQKHRNQWICEVCGKQFQTKQGITKHQQCHIGTSRKVKAMEGELESLEHRLAAKDSSPEFQCTSCGKVFSQMLGLKRHEERMHMERERFKCPKCGKMLLPGASVSYHLVACTQRDPNEIHECKICHKQFQNKFLIRQHHRLNHSGRKYLCSQCGKSFKRKPSLSKHLAVHSNDKPFVCDGIGCNASFKIKEHLRRHKKTCTACQEVKMDK